MTHASVLLAGTDVDDADLLLPTTVPTTWTGIAAASCQTSLDDVRFAMSGLDLLLATAGNASKLLDSVAIGCGGSPT